MFINVGTYADNERIKTKAELKRMVKESPELLRFDQTSALGNNGMPSIIKLDMLPIGMHLSVVGPDPYNSRKWYATVTFTGSKYTVS